MAQLRDTSVMQTDPGNIQQRGTSVIQPGSVLPSPQLVSFDIAYKQLMQRWEDPHLTGKITHDAGGATKYGISQNAYPSLDISTITASTAKEITERDYWMYNAWDISKLLSGDQPLANKFLQFGFNTGVGTVIQLTNMFLYCIYPKYGMPKLGQHLTVSEKLLPGDKADILRMLVASQLSRYVVDYHGLSRVPHSLMDRALCIE